MQDLGIIGYVSKGDYDSNTTYEKLNVVFYNGASFSAKQTTTGNTPTTGRSDDLYWQIMASAASGAIFPMGTITFANLPSSPVVGYLYNISDDFTTDSRFKEGSGVYYPAGSNVYYTSDGYWDVMAGSAVGGVKGNAESTYRTGLVNITPSNLGITSSDVTYGTDEKLYLIGAKTQTNNPTTYSDDTIYANANGLVAPTANSTVTYTTGDAADSSVTASTGWTSVAKLTSGLSHSTLMNYISKMFKNVRWLYKKIGTSSMGTSATTVTGAISEINSNLTNYVGLPDWNNTTILTERTVISYTAPSNGYIFVLSESASFSHIGVRINGVELLFSTNTIFFPVKSGDIITTVSSVRLAKFIPFI